MKSRNLYTIHDVIVRNYTITGLPSGKFLHQFTPATAETLYQFETNSSAAELVNGDRYNIGFITERDGRNVIEPSALGKADSVNKLLSYSAAKHFSLDKLAENKGKNDDRVKHRAVNGYYWGRKYAWRRFGLVMAKGAFYQYMEEIAHPFVPCKTINDDIGIHSNEDSIAYMEEGLEEAMDALIDTAEKVGRYFKSPRYSRKFQIRPVNAISDKK
ncbi:hypothetical protein PflCFBP13510_10600 [Pseudomonas fluorescens]|nr:hypothetical protein PflCFBP13510_10600 [Pseudomonas fluorescens]